MPQARALGRALNVAVMKGRANYLCLLRFSSFGKSGTFKRTEELPLSECSGRVLARELRAKEDVPPFDRSPYDGYAFRGEDTQSASAQSPVTLRLLEEVPAADHREPCMARSTITMPRAGKAR